MGKTFRNDAGSSRGGGTGSSRRGKLSKWELRRQIAESYRQRHQLQRPTPAVEDGRIRKQWERDPVCDGGGSDQGDGR